MTREISPTPPLRTTVLHKKLVFVCGALVFCDPKARVLSHDTSFMDTPG